MTIKKPFHRLEYRVALALNACTVALILAFTGLVDSVFHFYIAGLVPGTNYTVPWKVTFALSIFVGYTLLFYTAYRTYAQHRASISAKFSHRRYSTL